MTGRTQLKLMQTVRDDLPPLSAAASEFSILDGIFYNPNFPFGFDRSASKAASVDCLDDLSEQLGPNWEVKREIDYLGEISIIALPAPDIDVMPALILYEKDGQTHVATVRGADWETDRAFPSFREAMAAMTAEAATLVIACQAARGK